MNLQQMRYFLTVAETGNITKAAQLLHMAQPPLSRQIKQIENELETKLFTRNGRHLHLTEAGTLLLYRVREILNLTDRSLQEIKALTKNSGGTLVLGSVSSLGHVLLPELIKNFRRTQPQLQIELIMEETIKITELLEKGILEIGFVRQPFDTDFFDHYILPQEKLLAVYHKNIFHPSVTEGNIAVAELANYPLLIHHKYQSLIDSTFAQNNSQPKYFCRSNDILPLLSWADAGLGIVIIPESAAKLIKSSNLLTACIDDATLHTTGAMIWPKKQHQSALAQNFISFFKESMTNKKNAE